MEGLGRTPGLRRMREPAAEEVTEGGAEGVVAGARAERDCIGWGSMGVAAAPRPPPAPPSLTRAAVGGVTAAEAEVEVARGVGCAAGDGRNDSRGRDAVVTCASIRTKYIC